MNMNKKLIALIAGLAGVVLCVALLLFSCGGGESDTPTEPSLPDNETVLSTGATEETEAATEEPTEVPTEVPTEPEETTEPTQPSGGSRPGGTGGFEGGSTPTMPTQPEEDNKNEEEQLTLAEPGTAENPYAECLSDLPDELSTVAIPAGKTVSYQLIGAQDAVLTIADPNAYVTFNGKTYKAEGGVVTVQFPETEGPMAVQIGSLAGAEVTYDLDFSHPLGDEENPEVITSADQIQAKLGGTGKAVHYYSWTAEEYGKLTLKAERIMPATSQCKIEMTITSTDANGVTNVVTGTTTADGTAIPVDKGDEVIIAVSVTPANVQADVTISGIFEPSLGTISNPIPIPDVLIPYVAEVKPGDPTYYAGRAAGMVLTIQDAQNLTLTIGEETYLPDENGVITVAFPASTGIGPAAQTVLGLSTTETAAKNYTLTFSYPVGHPQNPAELALGENTAVIGADNPDGYNYVWTATGNGKLTITMTSEAWQYMVNNETAGYYGDLCDSSLEPSTAVTVLNVSEGDLVTMNVNGFDPEDPWAYPGGTVTFTAIFEVETGTQANPIWITEPTKPFVQEVPAGTTVYLTGRIFDVDMAIENAVGASVMLGDMTYGANLEGKLNVYFPAAPNMGRPEPVVFALTNGTDTDAVYTLNFLYPLGGLENPDQLKLGENIATLEAGSTVGYNYVWTAEEDGELTITMTGETWQYTVSNITSGIYGSNHLSHEEPVVASETLEVAVGDQITVAVNTFAPGEMETPAGDVAFTAAFESFAGNESNPITILDNDNTDGSVVTFTTGNQKAGRKYHYAMRAPGYDLQVTGEGAFTATYNGVTYTAVDGKILVPNFKAASMYEPAILILEGAGVFQMRMEPPLGVLDNPAELNVTAYNGNTAVLAVASEGYYFQYTAEEDGILTLTAHETENASGYQISTYNLSNYNMSEILDQTVGETLTTELKAGQVLRVIVNTYDPQNPYETPAGTVVFDASFAPPVGTEANPVMIQDNNTADGSTVTFTTGTQTAGTPVYYAMNRAPGFDLEITGEGDFTATYKGNVYTAQGGKAIVPAFKADNMYTPAVVAIDGDGVFQLKMEPPVGTVDNPKALNVTAPLGNTAQLGAGVEGYYFLFTAPADGTLIMSANAADNANGYQISALSLQTSASSEILDQTTGDTLKVAVKAGEPLRIAVNTFDPENVFSTPAGTVTFTASFVAAEFPGERTPTVAFDITLAENETLNYLEPAKGEKYVLVLDEATGFYHLDSLTGPVVYLNLGTVAEYEAPYLSLNALMGFQDTAEVPFGNGMESFNTCLKQYIRCADDGTGLYPLTEDLMYMLTSGGKAMGWYDAANGSYLFSGLKAEGKALNQDNAWLFACCVIAAN